MRTTRMAAGAMLAMAMALAGAALAATALTGSAWDVGATAHYLDQRTAWWQGWSTAQRERDTVCQSCHTTVPYALVRPALRDRLGETGHPAAERKLIADVVARVEHWAEFQPYYHQTETISKQARSTEAVLNAMILASERPGDAALDAPARAALDLAIRYQLHDGRNRGSWDWQMFHLAPWELPEAYYAGTAFMGVALGRAPQAYRAQPQVARAIAEMRLYLIARARGESLFNRLHLLWAARELPALRLPSALAAAIRADLAARQRPDGGWRLADLGGWKRLDDSKADDRSDGYATGLAVLALGPGEPGGLGQAQARGRAWLLGHQGPEGSWDARSLNKSRKPDHPAEPFMRDAATAYAALALLEPGRR